MITRWQAARGYPKSGYLNKLQHKALLTEIVATRSRPLRSDEEKPARRAAASSGGGGGGRPRRRRAAAVPVQPVVGGVRSAAVGRHRRR